MQPPTAGYIIGTSDIMGLKKEKKRRLRAATTTSTASMVTTMQENYSRENIGKERLQRHVYLSETSALTSSYISFHIVAEQKQLPQRSHHYSHQRRGGKENLIRNRHQERRQRHHHHHYTWVRNAVTTAVLYNTTTTMTGAHPVTSETTTKTRMTSWPLPFTSTTSTSSMESATCSTYHNHDYKHLQSLMVLHVHSLHGLMNFEHTSTSVGLSISTSWTSPTMRRNLLQQTSWCSRHRQGSDSIQRLYGLHKHVRTSETEDLDAQRVLQDARIAGVSRAGKLLGYLIVHATEPNSKPNNLLRRLQRTNVGWGVFRQLRRQYAAGARVQQYALLQSIVHPQS